MPTILSFSKMNDINISNELYVFCNKFQLLYRHIQVKFVVADC